MRPFRTLDSITTPEGRRLSLHQRDEVFFIHLDGEELMSSRAPGSESALAELACRALPDAKMPRVLIGGLGLGYTLRAALDVLPKRAEVIVAEVFPCVVEWHRRFLSALAAPLEDPRVRVIEADVSALVGDRHRHCYQAALLDVDNSPSAWCLESNAHLYSRQGIERFRQSIAPGGILAVWSAHRDAAFAKRLRRCGFDLEVRAVRARGRKGDRFTIFLARKPA